MKTLMFWVDIFFFFGKYCEKKPWDILKNKWGFAKFQKVVLFLFNADAAEYFKANQQNLKIHGEIETVNGFLEKIFFTLSRPSVLSK